MHTVLEHMLTGPGTAKLVGNQARSSLCIYCMVSHYVCLVLGFAVLSHARVLDLKEGREGSYRTLQKRVVEQPAVKCFKSLKYCLCPNPMLDQHSR